jgi:uncharacterized membrane protein
VAAVRLGHPEALTAALCVLAVVLARRDHWVVAAVVLGLAIATKQWAVVAIVPALLAAPGRVPGCFSSGWPAPWRPR